MKVHPAVSRRAAARRAVASPRGAARDRAGCSGVVAGPAAAAVAAAPRADPARHPRGRLRHLGREPGRAAGRVGRGRGRARRRRRRRPGDALERRQPRLRLRVGSPAGRHASLRDAAHVRRPRGPLLGAERRRQHRARGDDADRRVLRHLGRRRHRLVGARSRRRDGRRCACSVSCTRSSRSTSAPTRSSVGRRSTSSPSGRPATCS